ncbi:hypothetical protein GJ744_003494 [Endocarpon pusillum]|uniref:Cytochrome b-c1 complex subunit 8 n=1 Tax=Endocarpon pusillum TaxID=364733 RepID=A0A8H7AMA7_9EURO|nr:hypothetical protein GJ744_003494 [Endocarpon pusillum]
MRVSPQLRIQASRLLRDGGLDPKHGKFLGPWGNIGSQPQKGLTSYSLSPNRQRPLGGVVHAAIFNTTRRTKDQILFWLTPMVLGYAVMDWAIQKNEYYNSKPGRMAAEEHGAETEINMKG